MCDGRVPLSSLEPFRGVEAPGLTRKRSLPLVTGKPDFLINDEERKPKGTLQIMVRRVSNCSIVEAPFVLKAVTESLCLLVVNSGRPF